MNTANNIGAETALAFARVCMPDVDVPPQKVVISFRPLGLFIAVSHHLEGCANAIGTKHFELKSSGVDEILSSVFFGPGFDLITRMDLIIEAGKDTLVRTVQIVDSDTQSFLVGAQEMLEATALAGGLRVSPHAPNWEEEG